jgi:hypothetical protein
MKKALFTGIQMTITRFLFEYICCCYKSFLRWINLRGFCVRGEKEICEGIMWWLTLETSKATVLLEPERGK